VRGNDIVGKRSRKALSQREDRLFADFERALAKATAKQPVRRTAAGEPAPRPSEQTPAR